MTEQAAAIHRSSFILERLDIWIPALLGVAGLVASVALAVKIPDPTSSQIRVFVTLLALSAGAVAALIPGLLHVKVNAPGIAIRGAGAIGVFCIVFFQPPSTAVKIAQAIGGGPQQTVAGFAGPRASDLTREANAAMQRGERDKAFELWRHAAAGGDCIAAGNVAFALDNGLGTSIDKVAAGLQYKTAADCGNPTAQAVVASYYVEGSHGLPQDRALAISYYRMAQKSGVPAAIDGLKALGEQP
jgi:hypothetical protein